MYITRDIRGFYKSNEENNWYLEKYFANTTRIGYYEPYTENAFMGSEEAFKYDGDVATVDDDNTYEINGYGLRGQIYENAEVLAGGCSITFGIGIPEVGRWTNILSDKKNKDIMNLASPGASVESVCNTIIQYCMNNKMPKEIFCLMPDFFRRMVVVDKEFYKSKASKNSFAEDQDFLRLLYCNPIVYPYEQYVFMEVENKKYIEDSISPHQLILNSVNNIYALESFCLSNNIKLYWTTWDLSSSLIMQELLNVKDFKLKNFKSFFKPNRKDFNIWVDDNDHDLCIKSELVDTLHWGQGTDFAIIDGKKSTKHAHPGVHFQWHVANFFYNLSK